MRGSIPINLAVEDPLSEAVLLKILDQSGRPYEVGNCHKKDGFGYLRKTIGGFNSAAKGTPFLVLTDLDRYECPVALIQEWLTVPKHHNLLFRVAVREVESWLLADRTGFAKFLGIRESLVPHDADTIPDPKQYLINLVRKSRKRDLLSDIVPLPKSTATQGRNYNGPLISFVQRSWDLLAAMNHSPSLSRTVDAVAQFQPLRYGYGVTH